jgi:mannose-6-phosphate isomerase
MSGPIRFAPAPVERVWGGRKLETRLGRTIPSGRIGESWDVSARPEATSRTADGATPSDVLGAPFPLLVKVLDAAETLSVQVHPDDAACADLPGAEPKHEAWIVLDVEPGALIYRGFRDGVDRAAFEAAIDEGRIAATLHAFEAKPGDLIEIPCGTIHAIGGGCLLLEVQQPSDTTYRVFDWGRMGLDGSPRELHMAESLRSLDFGPRSPDRADAVDGAAFRLTVESVTAGDALALDPARVTVVSNVSDSSIHLAGDPRPLRFGDSVVYFPGCEATHIEAGEGRLAFTSAEIPR